MTSSDQADPAPPQIAAAEEPSGRRRRVKLPLWKKVVFASVVFVLAFTAFELVARVGSFVFSGFNAYYLFYGYQPWRIEPGFVNGESKKHVGYFKFLPNRFIRGKFEPAWINNRGFRGADFAEKKAAGTFRILCLGSSSTYGYGDRDAFTYPAILGRLFEQRDSVPTVEVINCGIPQFRTHHILAMFREELLRYEPDLVTLYEGWNNVFFALDETPVQRVQRWLDENSAAYAGMRKVVGLLGGQLHGRLVNYLPQLDRAAVARQHDLQVAMFRENVSALIDLAKQRNVQVVLVKQAMHRDPQFSDGRPKEDDGSLSYEERYNIVAQKLEHEGRIHGLEAPILFHHSLMGVLTDLAQQHDLPLVDNIALVDDYPAGLIDTVHLSEEGNRRLAEQLFKVIEPMVRRDQEPARPSEPTAALGEGDRS